MGPVVHWTRAIGSAGEAIASPWLGPLVVIPPHLGDVFVLLDGKKVMAFTDDGKLAVFPDPGRTATIPEDDL